MTRVFRPKLAASVGRRTAAVWQCAAPPPTNPLPDYDEELSLITRALLPPEPPAGLEARILASAFQPGRFDSFRLAVSELLDLSEARASAVLDALEHQDAWTEGLFAGMELSHVQGGPKVQHALTGFVRIRAGLAFPDHEHLGEERVLILQGSCLDGKRLLRSGDRTVMPPGSAHQVQVRPGPDLLYLAVLHQGLRIGNRVLRAPAPEY